MKLERKHAPKVVAGLRTPTRFELEKYAREEREMREAITVVLAAAAVIVCLWRAVR